MKTESERNNKSVGVALATYNGEKYIAEQLLSIINQTRCPDFIVVSDGMSDDTTVSITRSLLEESKIEHLVLTSDVRLSVTENFQKALSACDTDYVFISDQDDVWNENKIELMLKTAGRTHAGMVFSNALLVDSSLNELGGATIWDTIGYSQSSETMLYEKEDTAFINLLLKDNIATGMCMCISRELKERAMPLSKHGLHDVWLTLVSSLYFRTVALNESLVLYRQHDTNAVGGTGGLSTSIKNGPYFFERMQDRTKITHDVIDKTDSDGVNHEIAAMLLEYEQFILQRLEYIAGQRGFPVREMLNGLYFRYTRKPFAAVAKDIYARFFLPD